MTAHSIGREQFAQWEREPSVIQSLHCCGRDSCSETAVLMCLSHWVIVCMVYLTMSARSDQPHCTIGYSSDVIGHIRSFPAGSCEWCAGRPSGLPDTPTRVGLACRAPATMSLISLHWLSVPQIIHYKLAVLTWNIKRRHRDLWSHLDPIVRVFEQHRQWTLRLTHLCSVTAAEYSSLLLWCLCSTYLDWLPNDVTSRQLKQILFQQSSPSCRISVDITLGYGHHSVELTDIFTRLLTSNQNTGAFEAVDWLADLPQRTWPQAGRR